MKKLQIFFLFMILYFVGVSGVHAQQQQTVYQKKITEITIKYFKILYGYNKQLTVYDKIQLGMMTNGKEASNFILGIGMLSYASNHSETDAKKLIYQIKSELKQAEKLKSIVDFKRERDAKEKKEKEEKERKLRAEKDAYEKTDIGNIKNTIKTAIEEWSKKGEFEKEVDYVERLKKQSQTAFEKICIEQIKTRIQSFSIYSFQKILSIYNSEGEFFMVTFKANGVEWQSKINIPITRAEDFKNNWSDFKMIIDNYDWCFIENSLCPTLITLENQDKSYVYKFPLTLKNQTEISYLFDNFNIENQYLKGYVFKYSNSRLIGVQIQKVKLRMDSLELVTAQQKEKEKLRMDSLELIVSNQKLDSILKEYNRQLLLNPYNIGQKSISDYTKINSMSDIENSFQNSVSSIKYNFRKLNDNLELDLKRENPTEYCKIYYAQYPNKIAEADKKYLECKCNYPIRLNFDLNFINGNLDRCNCRENEYKEKGALFANKNEFNSFYDKGNIVLQEEFDKRTALNYLKINSSFLESMNFKKEKKESFGSTLGKGLLSVASGTTISEKDYTNENSIRKNILSLINESKNKPYYSQIMDSAIEINKSLNKEWTKNGHFFESKAEFYNAYLSSDYKQLLNEKKR